MKTIALFGVSGRTGKPLLDILLKKGYSVQALVRNPKNFAIKHQSLTIHQGNILTPEDVERTIAGADAVISVIGHVRGDTQPKNIQTIGAKNIIAAMEKHGVKRLLSLTGGAVPYKDDQPKFADKAIRFIMNIIAKDTLYDAIAHASVIAKSRTEWTIIRGPRLLEKPAQGSYRFGMVGVNGSTSITYPDLAQSIADELENGKYIHSMPFVSH